MLFFVLFVLLLCSNCFLLRDNPSFQRVVKQSGELYRSASILVCDLMNEKNKPPEKKKSWWFW